MIIEEHYQIGDIGRAIICNKPAINSPEGFRISFRGKPIGCENTIESARMFLRCYLWCCINSELIKKSIECQKITELNNKLPSKLNEFQTFLDECRTL